MVERDDGYVPSGNGTNTDTVSGNTLSNPKTNTVNFVNRKGFVLPSIVVKIVPFLLIIALILVATYMIRKNQKVKEGGKLDKN